MVRLSILLQIAGVGLLIPAWGFEPGPDRVVIAAGRTSGSFIGIGVAEITAERAKELRLAEERGVEITKVEDDSPAQKGGLQTADVVLEYNEQRVDGVEQFMRLVQETPVGREVKISVSRAGSPQQLVLKTASRKAWLASRYGEHAIEIPRIELPDVRVPEVPRAYMSWRSGFLGLEAESLDAQLADFFGVKEGVLVRSVVKGSAADRAGLRAGDVIVRVDETKVGSPREITSAVRATRSKKSVTLSVVREKREIALTLPIDDANSELHHAIPKRVVPTR